MACSWIPPAVYIDGPQDGHTAAGAKRASGTLHPPYRTPEGHIVRGDQPPDDPHYAYRADPTCERCRWGRHYEWVEGVS